MLQKYVIIWILFILISPFGLYVQAEEDKNNLTVEEAITNLENQQNQQVDEQKEENDSIIESEPPALESPFSWIDFMKMIFALVVVIALIYSILRFIHKKNRLFGQLKAMENLGGLSLGPNRSIQLVRIGEAVFIVGVGENVQLLKEITNKEEIERFLAQRENPTMQLGSDFINKFLSKKEQSTISTSHFRQMLKGQLKDLSEGRKEVYEKIKKEQQE